MEPSEILQKMSMAFDDVSSALRELDDDSSVTLLEFIIGIVRGGGVSSHTCG